MYSHSVVEPALAKFFEVAPGQSLAFGAKVRNLQRLGLVKKTLGSGNRREYSLNDVCDLALALSYAEFGANPSKVVRAVRAGLFDDLQLQLDLENPDFEYLNIFEPRSILEDVTQREILGMIVNNKVDISVDRAGVINISRMRRTLISILSEPADGHS